MSEYFKSINKICRVEGKELMRYSEIMKVILCTISLCICSVSILMGGILDSKVPWSGKIRRTDFGSMISRMQGWSEGQGLDVGSFRLVDSLPKGMGSKEIRRLVIADKPRPTYGDVLKELYKLAGREVVLTEVEEGIQVTYLYTKSIRLNHATKERLRKANLLTSEGVVAKMKEHGVKMSVHHRVGISKVRNTLTVSGTIEDLKSASRFFGIE